MNNTLLIAILAGLGGMIGWGVSDFFAKKAVDEVGPIKSLVWAHIFGVSLLLIVAVMQFAIFGLSIELPNSVTTWFGFALFGGLQMVIYWLVYQGFEKGQLAVLNPVFASYSGLVVLLSVVFFGEAIGLVLIAGLIIIFIGNLLLNIDPQSLRAKSLKISPGLKEVGAAAVLAAFWTLGWARFTADKQAVSSALLMYAFMSIAAYVLSLLMKVRLSGVPNRLWKFLFFMGFGEMLAYLSISWGFANSRHTSIIALISGAFSVPAVVLAYMFLKERLTKLQVAAICIIVIGIVLISVT